MGGNKGNISLHGQERIYLVWSDVGERVQARERKKDGRKSPVTSHSTRKAGTKGVGLITSTLSCWLAKGDRRKEKGCGP